MEEVRDLLDLETSSKDIHIREDKHGNTGSQRYKQIQPFYTVFRNFFTLYSLVIITHWVELYRDGTVLPCCECQNFNGVFLHFCNGVFCISVIFNAMCT